MHYEFYGLYLSDRNFRKTPAPLHFCILHFHSIYRKLLTIKWSVEQEVPTDDWAMAAVGPTLWGVNENSFWRRCKTFFFSFNSRKSKRCISDTSLDCWIIANPMTSFRSSDADVIVLVGEMSGCWKKIIWLHPVLVQLLFNISSKFF